MEYREVQPGSPGSGGRCVSGIQSGAVIFLSVDTAGDVFAEGRRSSYGQRRIASNQRHPYYGYRLHPLAASSGRLQFSLAFVLVWNGGVGGRAGHSPAKGPRHHRLEPKRPYASLRHCDVAQPKQRRRLHLRYPTDFRPTLRKVEPC